MRGCSGANSFIITRFAIGSLEIPRNHRHPPERNFGRNREWAHLFINIIGDLVNVVTRHDYRSLIGLPIAGAMIFYLA